MSLRLTVSKARRLFNFLPLRLFHLHPGIVKDAHFVMSLMAKE